MGETGKLTTGRGRLLGINMIMVGGGGGGGVTGEHLSKGVLGNLSQVREVLGNFHR